MVKGFRRTFKSPVRGKLCWANTGDGIGRIELRQRGPDNFTVVYGLQLEEGLTYVEAAKALGLAIMHFQACESLLDNRTKQEARNDQFHGTIDCG